MRRHERINLLIGAGEYRQKCTIIRFGALVDHKVQVQYATVQCNTTSTREPMLDITASMLTVLCSQAFGFVKCIGEPLLLPIAFNGRHDENRWATSGIGNSYFLLHYFGESNLLLVKYPCSSLGGTFPRQDVSENRGILAMGCRQE